MNNTVITAQAPFRHKRKVFTKSRIILFMIALPLFLLVLAFQYVPIFGWYYAFTDYRPGIPLSETPFVGLKYFRWMIEDKAVVLNALINTLAMSFLAILASPISVAFAILLNEIYHKKFKKFVQTLTTLPYFISMIITYSLATILLSSSGLLNEVLLNLGLIEQPTNILGNREATWWFQTAVGVWKNFGFGAIIYLAAIAGIDQEMYDAARVDGAGRFQRMLHITIPGILPTFFVLLLLNIAGILNTGLDQHFVFYNALVADKIETIDYYTYRIGIEVGNISYGTAIGFVKTIVSITLLFSMNALSKVVRGQAVF
jgi:putative aldouronate transport system permease protein